MTRRAARRSLRWPLVGATALLLVVYVWSAFRTIDLPNAAGVEVFILGGRLTLYRMTRQSWVAVRGLEHWSWSLYFDRSASWWWLHIPLWMFAIPLVAATAWAWWPRPGPPGTCPKCGYDRTGIGALTACPECGRPENVAL